MAAEYEEVMGATHVERDDFGHSENNPRSTIFSSAVRPWYRMFASIAKANDWVVDDALRNVLQRSQCIVDGPDHWETELMYRCRGRGTLFLDCGLEHFPQGPEYPQLLQELLADVKYARLSTDEEEFDVDILPSLLSCMSNLEVVHLADTSLVRTVVAALTPVARRCLKVVTIEGSMPSAVTVKELVDCCDHLHTCDFGRPVTQDLISSLSRIAPQLQSVSLYVGTTDRLDWQPLTGACRNLRRLHICSRYGVHELDFLSRLSVAWLDGLVDLSYPLVDEDLINVLKAHGHKLKSLSVKYGWGHNFAAPSVQLLATIASSCTSLRSFKLSDRSEFEPASDLTHAFKALPQLRNLHINYSMLAYAEIVSIGHLGNLKELTLDDVKGITDDALCALAPQLPLIESLSLTRIHGISAIGVNAFIQHPNSVSKFYVDGIKELQSDAVAAAILGNSGLCRRLTEISIAFCAGAIKCETLRGLGHKCCKLTYLFVPAPPTPYPEEVVRLFCHQCIYYHDAGCISDGSDDGEGDGDMFDG